MRANLFDFLEGVASLAEAAEYRFWIDQLSIDQHNNREKNHQVQHMRTIFNRAREVIVWLGREEDDSEVAMQAVRNWPLDTRLIPARQEVALMALFNRSFWNRLWIVQEVVLAKEVYVLCGRSFFEWSDVQVFFGAEPRLWESLTEFFSHRPAAASLLRARPQAWSGRPRIRLMAALSFFHLHECENPRDKVYGIMGVVLENEQIPIDYSKPVEDVFADAAAKTVGLNLAPDRTRMGSEMAQVLVNLGCSMGVVAQGLHESKLLRYLIAFEFDTEVSRVFESKGSSIAKAIPSYLLPRSSQPQARKRRNLDMNIKVLTSPSRQAQRQILSLRDAIIYAIHADLPADHSRSR